MTRRRLQLREQAVVEAAQAYHWYAQRSAVAAENFLDRLEAAFSAILDAPDRWPEYTDRTRRYLMRRFPYMIVYRVVGEKVVVLAIAHTKQRPGYWRSRLT